MSGALGSGGLKSAGKDRPMVFPERFLKRFGEQRRWTMVFRLSSLRAEGCLNSLSLHASELVGESP